MLLELTEAQLTEMFDEALDEGRAVEIGTLTYSPSQVLKAVDPIAYRTGLADYADSLIRDGYTVEGYN
jgi:hypothetical protein